jgi:hypothetical protein
VLNLIVVKNGQTIIIQMGKKCPIDQVLRKIFLVHIYQQVEIYQKIYNLEVMSLCEKLQRLLMIKYKQQQKMP